MFPCHFRLFISQHIFGQGLSEIQQSFTLLFVAKLRGIIFFRQLTVYKYVICLCQRNGDKHNPFRNRCLVSPPNALSPTGTIARWHCVTRPNNGCNQEITVSVAPMRHIFAQKHLNNRDNKPQNTPVSSDKLLLVLFFF